VVSDAGAAVSAVPASRTRNDTERTLLSGRAHDLEPVSKLGTLIRRFIETPIQEAAMRTTTTGTSQVVTSADGTEIAYETTGTGPALVLVDGAMCHRALGPARSLAAELSDRFTVLAYDRRGRGASGRGTTPWTVDREVEDLLAVLEAAGGRAHVLGVSSGATLALEAARSGAPIDRLAVYESPFILDDTHPANDPRLPEQVRAMVEADRRSEAVKTFLRTVGAPPLVILMMRFMPPWKRMTAVAHTLPHDLSMVSEHQQGRPLPAGYYEAVSFPTLVIAGGKSPTYMRNAQARVAAALPNARLETLPGQTHMVKARVVAPAVASFLG
jgi:pimeloyl-ACP methyl ester carboxylesterase